jgi:hypothetical protein
MKQLCILFYLLPLAIFAQQKPVYNFEASYFYGNIIPHRETIQHLITNHPTGMILSANRKTFGEREWERAFNFPDYGLSIHYQDMHNEMLGELYGLYVHYNFYFLNRNLQLRLGQGVAYNTNPYDRETNFRNYAYSTHLMPSTYFMINFNRQNIWQGLGVQAGMVFIHHSNASMKLPNTSTNTFAINAGINYTFGKNREQTYITLKDSIDYTEPFKFTAVFRGGYNESGGIGMGGKPYYAVSLYADKRISRKSAFQLGADVFWSQSLKQYIQYKAIAYPEENVDADTDYRKVGVFVGYELFINKLSAEVQAGAYVYAPFKDQSTFYQRVGLKYYLYEGLFTGVSLKTHTAKAEVMEVNLGIRF